MSNETKVGLVVSLAVILAFAIILSLNLSHEEYADSGTGDDAEGTHLTQYRVRTSGGEPPADDVRATERTPLPASEDDRRVVDAEAGGEAVEHGTDAGEDEDRGLMVAVEDEGPDDLSRYQEPADSERAVDSARRAVQPPEPAQRHYTVLGGDTLFDIAEKVYGSGRGPLWRRIAAANRDVDPLGLRPGMRLVIPPDERRVQPVAPDDGQRDVETARGPEVYVVERGDTLGHISTKVYGTCKKWKLIQQANGDIDPGALRVGTSLVIPREGPVAVARRDDDVDSTKAVEEALEEVRRFVADRDVAAPYSPYTVARGDTLSAISRKHFGTSARWKDIYELNRDTLPRPDAMRPGQVIRVPAVTRTAMVERTGSGQ